MADKPSKKPRVRKTETVRDRAVKSDQKPKPKAKRIRRTASVASRPLLASVRLIKTLARPFGFILWPFKTRPVRFIGRWLGKLLLINYLVSAWQELRLVSWPNRKETRQLTLAVFAFAIVFSALIMVVDYGLDKLFKQLLLK